MNYHKSSGFRYACPSLLNPLAPHLRSIDTYSAFKFNLKLIYSLLFSTSLAPNIASLCFRVNFIDFSISNILYYITACVAALCSVKDGFSSKGKTLIFDCSPDPNPVTDQHQPLQN